MCNKEDGLVLEIDAITQADTEMRDGRSCAGDVRSKKEIYAPDSVPVNFDITLCSFTSHLLQASVTLLHFLSATHQPGLLGGGCYGV